MKNQSQQLIETIRYATIKHHGQIRSGTGLPYIVHPLEVAQILCEEGYHNATYLLQAAILHDVIEDTDATYEEVKEKFGVHVADLVMEVTDDQSLTKKEQRIALMEKIPKMSNMAKMLKIADGISNVSSTSKTTPENWSTSLKLAYIKTCSKVAKQCHEMCHHNVAMYERFTNEVSKAKKRLQK